MTSLKKEAGQMRWPHERKLRGGLTGYKIYGTYCSPFLAQWIKPICLIVKLFGGMYFLFEGSRNLEDEFAIFWWPVSFIIGVSLLQYFGVIQWFMTLFFGHSFYILIRPSFIHIGKWYGYKTLNLNGADVELGIEDHPKLHKEYEYLKENPKEPQKEEDVYYKNSPRVFLRYGEHKHNIATLYHNPAKADSIVRRINQRLNEFNMGGGC